MSFKWHLNKDLFIETLSHKHVNETLDLIVDAFLNRNEPGSYQMRPYQDTWKFSVLYHLNRVCACNDKMSLIMMDKESNNKIVGVNIVYDYYDKISPEFIAEFRTRRHSNDKLRALWRQNFARGFELDKPLKPHIQKYVKGKDKGNVLYFFMGAVHQDYQKQNIS
eukprot:371959_1